LISHRGVTSKKTIDAPHGGGGEQSSWFTRSLLHVAAVSRTIGILRLPVRWPLLADASPARPWFLLYKMLEYSLPPRNAIGISSTVKVT
jgi:hypothetical protein